jgi:hypothetical protein
MLDAREVVSASMSKLWKRSVSWQVLPDKNGVCSLKVAAFFHSHSCFEISNEKALQRPFCILRLPGTKASSLAKLLRVLEICDLQQPTLSPHMAR